MWNDTQKKLDYHNHFHKVLKILGDSVCKVDILFVDSRTVLQLTSKIFLFSDCEIVFTKLHKHDDFHEDWMWVGGCLLQLFGICQIIL